MDVYGSCSALLKPSSAPSTKNIMTNLQLRLPAWHDPSIWFLDTLQCALGMSINSATDRVVDVKVFFGIFSGESRTMHTFVEQELPTALDLVRRLQKIPQFYDIHAAITLERDLSLSVYADTLTFRKCLYFQPIQEYGTMFQSEFWMEESWYPI